MILSIDKDQYCHICWLTITCSCPLSLTGCFFFLTLHINYWPAIDQKHLPPRMTLVFQWFHTRDTSVIKPDASSASDLGWSFCTKVQHSEAVNPGRKCQASVRAAHLELPWHCAISSEDCKCTYPIKAESYSYATKSMQICPPMWEAAAWDNVTSFLLLPSLSFPHSLNAIQQYWSTVREKQISS